MIHNLPLVILIIISVTIICIVTISNFINALSFSSGDEHITSLCEFTVHKVSRRHNDPVRRTLCISESCLLERDPNSYAIVTLKPLSDIFALVRHQENPQMLTIEYVRGGNRVYTSSDR